MLERRSIALPERELDVFLDGPASSALAIAAAHPVEAFGAGTAALLAEATGARTVCFEVAFDDVAPDGGATAPTLERMVERIDAVRRGLGIDRWIFWGMSGGGWLAQIYAHLHTGALRAVVIESACACFRERLADPDCIASPFYPAWRDRLRDAGLLSTTSHRAPSSGDDAEWTVVEGVGQVFRRRGGPALVVLPGPPDPRMRRAMPRLWEIDARPWLGAIRVPALVVCGAADPVVPLRHARAVHDAIAGSTWVEIEGAGHVPTAERHPEVAAAFERFAAAANLR